MVVEILNEIRKLDERELLSYWIKGEYEEAETYWKLAERAKELGLPEEVVNTFKRLGDESKGHGDELYKIYRQNYGDELVEVNVPNVESLNVLGKFWKVEDLKDVLEIAMESEKLAETIYRKLAEECKKEELKRVYLTLADVERGHYESLKKLAGGIVNGRP
ncbi:rubrerythrin-related protein [Thermococcus kodakarensis KOD1]|uniref:Rubrerythrin-related protein n=1 Tax=Thermococcus kodakarensis (strain ATCC BAA-918 / JCM 12380 / KOD1) TaxID=69014 RepID=Q5JIK9_THEKO|nr:ferritin family protein [Thermococcus kodakarensis]WCN27950.1 ferritin family protein [Thermococcus kodakarensis]WCN30249.1 ferritin family protein [Thermococcus kodakarensis]BAD86284.1 rubrerythrin-related protein [Thermococcus kodakarensis KOD1]